MQSTPSPQQIEQASRRIADRVRLTPVHATGALTPARELFLKLENLQHTGSFKARGALNAVLNLPQGVTTVVTASTGNHGAGVAWAAQPMGLRVVVYVPENALESKLARMRDLGAEIVVHGTDSGISEAAARAWALQTGAHYLSAYNDPDVIAGQGTVGVEMVHQAGPLDAIFVAVGGGGLIGGIATYAKHVNPKTRVYGCYPAASPAMAVAVRTGHVQIVEHRETLSDGTAGGLDPDPITLPLCKALVDEWIAVDEPEIAAAMRAMLAENIVIEGAAGVALSAAQDAVNAGLEGRVGVVMCGGNVSGKATPA